VQVLRQKFIEDYGITPTKLELGRCLGDWEFIFSLGVPEAERPAFKQSAEDAAYSKYLTTDLYDAVASMLMNLKTRGKNVALITASKRQPISEVLTHHNLTDYFDLVVTADDVKVHKPDPQGVLLALDYFGTTKQQAVMLGDTDKDLGAARNAGIDSILFYPESHQPFYDRDLLQSFGPVQVLSHWGELA
jgi:HAD superfamily hydrolase (TIGR01549 family)